MSDRYGRFYAPLAVACLLLSGLPLFKDVVIADGDTQMTESYGTIFEMAGRPGGQPAVFGVMLLASLVILLVVATVRHQAGMPLPAAIAFVAALITMMLVIKPGTGTPAPALTDSGTAGLVLAAGTCLLAIVHVLHPDRGARPARQPSLAHAEPRVILSGVLCQADTLAMDQPRSCSWPRSRLPLRPPSARETT